MSSKHRNAPLFPLVGPGGTAGFECPVCHRPVWIKVKNSPEVVACPSCMAAVRVPDEAAGRPAEIVSQQPAQRNQDLRDKTVLPPKRQTDESPVGKGRIDRPNVGGINGAAPPPSDLLTADIDDEPEFNLRADLAPPQGTAPGPAPQPGILDEPEPAELGRQAPLARDPAIHRLNPNKNAKLVALGELAAESKEQPEWRMDVLERKSADETVAKRWKGGNLIWFGVLLVACVIGVMAFIGTQGTPDAPEPPGQTQQQRVFAIEERNESLLSAVKTFLATNSIEERLALVRYPEQTRPRMISFEERHPEMKSLTVVGKPVSVSGFSRDGKEFGGLIVDFDDFSRRGTIFEKTDEGWKLDWDSFVGYSDMDWGDFLGESPEEAVLFRVIVAHDTYFNFEYDDSKSLSCYRIEDVTRTQSCWGYCEKGSEVDRELTEALKAARRSRFNDCEAVVKLRFEPKGKGRKQVWIDEFLAEGHLVP